MEVSSASEALDQLRRGSRQRQRAETGLNYSSSRSHSIFTVGGLAGCLSVLRSLPSTLAVTTNDVCGRMSR